MNLPRVRLILCLLLTGALARAADDATNAAAALPRTDANGNPLRRAHTGHVSNYDEAKVGDYTLPDPLVLENGQRVTDPGTWFKQRRPEILRLYEAEIYGRVPERPPKVRWELAETDTNALGGAAVRKEVIGHIGAEPEGPLVHVHLYLPSRLRCTVTSELDVPLGMVTR